MTCPACGAAVAADAAWCSDCTTTLRADYVPKPKRPAAAPAPDPFAAADPFATPGGVTAHRRTGWLPPFRWLTWGIVLTTGAVVGIAVWTVVRMFAEMLQSLPGWN